MRRPGQAICRLVKISGQEEGLKGLKKANESKDPEEKGRNIFRKATRHVPKRKPVGHCRESGISVDEACLFIHLYVLHEDTCQHLKD